MMNSFNRILNDIYNKIDQECLYDENWDNLLEDAVQLWCQRINFSEDYVSFISSYANLRSIKKSVNFWGEWKPNKRTEYPLDLLIKSSVEGVIKVIETLSNQLLLGTKNMNNLKFIVFLGLVITGVGFVVYKLNQQKPSTTNQRSSRSSGYETEGSFNSTPPAPIPQTLILVVNALKKDCLDKIESQGNKIQSEDCEKLYRATSFLWMGAKSELNQKLKDPRDYVAQQESEYDVYLVEIELSEAKEGFKENAGQLSRIDAFRELTNLTVKVSSRLKVSVYENTNVYTR